MHVSPVLDPMRIANHAGVQGNQEIGNLEGRVGGLAFIDAIRVEHMCSIAIEFARQKRQTSRSPSSASSSVSMAMFSGAASAREAQSIEERPMPDHINSERKLAGGT